ncbi:hypothetical protein EDD37DRAFT_653211 [Exophiala viscosa]|uniref:uncharacterized protein n=1 Tax=Exophiala viscosa TaxID=2486360 RepID=UPI002195DE42|nr:hypothetical protein EDD37DRAFT_653211 [Exophiala viscosa]
MEAAKAFMSGGGGGNGGEGDGLPKNANGEMPSREEMLKTIESLQKAQKAESSANDLKSKAMNMLNSSKRESMLKEAFDKEMEAHGHSKMAKRLQSGGWQGFGFGGGIGAATGIGLGAGLGTVLGAIAMVPTTGLGMLVGTGVGAIRGPFIKLGGKEEPFEDADPEKVVDALEKEQQNYKSQSEQSNSESGTADSKQGGEQKPRRKPKKLEIRSQKGKEEQAANASDKSTPDVKAGVSDESKPKRKPPKLEIRSGKGKSGSNGTAAKT